LVVLEDGADAKLIESYVGLKGIYFTNAVTEVYLGPDAILEHTKYQEETEGAVHIANLAVHQEESSIYTSNLTNFGGQIVRNDINTWLNGEHSETWLNAATVGLRNQVIDNHTRIDHAKPNCNSFEVYKQILGDRAVGIFNGKIFVYEDAQKTDAKQTNQAILLSPTATVNTKPQLEIFADDVKCTHGATIGQLREDALFYLQARGIPKK
jgi:Fe-S cluster assembly protein SufD